MTNVTKYPNNYDTVSGGKYQPFKNLKNIKTSSTTTYAETDGLIHGKKQPVNRPGYIKTYNFKCGIPVGSNITKITVYYTHSKVAYKNEVCNIPAPSISLLDGDKVLKYKQLKNNKHPPMTKTGKAPTTKIVKDSVSFTSSFDYNLINSKNFGVKIDYPSNTNDKEGYLRVYNVYIVVTYTIPSFGVKISAGANNSCENGDDYSAVVTLSNKNKTTYVPLLTITCPLGFTLKDNPNVTKINNRVFTWKPQKLSATSTVTLNLIFETDVLFTGNQSSYSGEFSVSESYTGKSSSFTAVIKPKPAIIVDVPEDNAGNVTNTNDSEDLGVTSEQLYSLVWVYTEKNSIYIDDDIYNQGSIQLKVKVTQPTDVPSNFDFKWANGGWFSTQIFHERVSTFTRTLTDNLFTYEMAGTQVGQYSIEIYYNVNNGNDVFLKSYYLNVIPADLGLPYFSILEITGEELDRLGHDTSYILQSYFKVSTSETLLHDWGRNFRMGIFNNAITANMSTNEYTDENGDIISEVIDSTNYSELTPSDIFENAEYWSDLPISPNEFNEVTLKFPYNENYPLYIIFSGDYTKADPVGDISFSSPCLIEDNFYEGYEQTGIYPVPINNTLVNEDGDFAELNIPSLNSATPIIFHELPLEDDYGTDEDMAIRGVEVTGSIESNTDDLNIYVKLVSPTGESRVRSLNLDSYLNKNESNTFSIGGMGDLWGLSTFDMIDLADWDVEFMVDNSINNNTGTINFTDMAVIFYVAEVDQQDERCFIEGEDLAYYGAFIRDLEIPEGLKTETKFLEIAGTDTNYPYNQAIREKTIELELDIGDSCNAAESTLSLRELTRLIVNKRDKYGHPIPKRIEFNHYPDVYWEYIIEDTFDNPLEISGYKVKAKLTVPAGTAFKKEATSTNRMGYINGLVNVHPVITVKPTDNLISISEVYSEQLFSMGYNGDLTDKVIIIDCEDRTVLLKDDEDDETGEDISYSADWNVDWFSLIDEYEFECTGGIIKNVSYVERW